MASARPAGDRRLACGCAGAAAGIAGFVAADAYGFFNSENGFLEFQFEVFAKIGAALHAGAALAPAAAASEDVEAEEVAEDVMEIVEDGLVEAASAVAADGGMAEAVVGGAFVGVGEHGIGFGRFLELLLGFRVAGVAVGVVLHGELAVGAFDLLIAGTAFYT